MHPILRNILAVVAGAVLGGIANMAIVILGSKVLPMEGVDMNDYEALGNFLSTADLQYFIFPFLAHAGGTFIGAFIAAKLGASRHLVLGMIIGVFFLIGGIMAVQMIPAPLWYDIVDLTLAYIPAAYLGVKAAGKA